MIEQFEPTSDKDRNEITSAGRLLAKSLRVTGAEQAADTVDRLVELAYEDGSRSSFFLYRGYLDEWKFALAAEAGRGAC